MIVVSRDLSRSVGNSLIRNMEENVDLESETSSDESTWNLELPNILGINLDSDSENTELTKDSREAEHAGLGGFGHGGHEAHGGHRELGELGELGGPAEDDSDVCNHVIQHLHEEIEKREINLRSNQSIISSIQSELREKDRIIREQVETINSYREELVCLDDPTSYGGGNPPCPNQRRREAERSQLRRLRRRVKQGLEKRSTPETNVGIAQALSGDSSDYSEPEPGISLARIGLQPQLLNDEHCVCNSSIFLSDSETEQNNCSSLTSCASACLSSSSRIIQGLVGSILHGLDECELLDSGIDEDILDVEDLEEDPLNFCSSCTRSLPREFGENLHDVQRGLLHVQQRVQFRKYKLERRAKRGIPAHEKDVYQLRAEVEELKDKLNTNYILVAQLSAENLRIQGEKNRLDEAVKERMERMKDMEERTDEMEEKILNLNSSLEDKQKEIEGWRRKGDELDTARRELEAARRELKILEEQVQQLKTEIEKNDYRETVFEKSSPETSSSFDYMNCGTNTGEVGSRPRAFSSCTRSFPVNLGRDKLVDVSSPDLGVDVESDPFSSLERGYKVGSLAVDKLILENRNLRREKDVLGQKLVRSKAALQDTLSRLSRANLHKQDQVVSPAPVRRPLSRVPSERGNLLSDSPPSLWSWSHESPGLRRRNPESPPPLPRVPDLNFKLRKNKSSRH
ncbi:uncharacterized protein LOC111714527 [Eurytemora carolleeae]|uniref:uncharacterized protein LOC111714527 n=1 Tax=Eurytemora carolleeae TaxID=1294199 RepID=UPI000C78C961|nr:uncharacterized protein LOC111714527 [Eurytemora carolleeae]|eukprot:XP_023345428.1 uncharacterized protein LOC111714527 [Eurytemora affinis]